MEPGPIRGPFVEWWALRKTNRLKTQKPSQSFVEGIFDVLTSQKQFFLTPLPYMLSILSLITFNF